MNIKTKFYNIGHLLSHTSFCCEPFMHCYTSYVRNRLIQIYKEDSRNEFEYNLFMDNIVDNVNSRNETLYQIIKERLYLNTGERIESYIRFQEVIVHTIKEFADILIILRNMFTIYSNLYDPYITSKIPDISNWQLENCKTIGVDPGGIYVTDTAIKTLMNALNEQSVHNNVLKPFDSNHLVFLKELWRAIYHDPSDGIYSYLCCDPFFASSDTWNERYLSSILNQPLYGILMYFLYGCNEPRTNPSIFVPIGNNQYRNFISERVNSVYVHSDISTTNVDPIMLEYYKQWANINTMVSLKKIDEIVKIEDTYSYFQLYQLLGVHTASRILAHVCNMNVAPDAYHSVILDDYHITFEMYHCGEDDSWKRKYPAYHGYIYSITHSSLANLPVEKVKKLAPAIVDNLEKRINPSLVKYNGSLEDLATQIDYYYNFNCVAYSLDLSDDKYNEIDKIIDFKTLNDVD